MIAPHSMGAVPCAIQCPFHLRASLTPMYTDDSTSVPGLADVDVIIFLGVFSWHNVRKGGNAISHKASGWYAINNRSSMLTDGWVLPPISSSYFNQWEAWSSFKEQTMDILLPNWYETWRSFLYTNKFWNIGRKQGNETRTWYCVYQSTNEEIPRLLSAWRF